MIILNNEHMLFVAAYRLADQLCTLDLVTTKLSSPFAEIFLMAYFTIRHRMHMACEHVQSLVAGV